MGILRIHMEFGRVGSDDNDNIRHRLGRSDDWIGKGLKDGTRKGFGKQVMNSKKGGSR